MKYIKTSNEPFRISATEVENLRVCSERVYQLVNKTLEVELKKGNFKYLDPLQGNEKKATNMMRIDYAWDMNGNLKVLELNAAGQQGWLLIKESENQVIAEDTLSPHPDFLPEFLYEKLGSKIAIISNYTEEELTKDVHSDIEIVELKKIRDAIKVKHGGDSELVNFDKDSLKSIKDRGFTGIYWRGNHSISDELTIEEKVKIASYANDSHLPQIPSFEYLFVADDKSFLQYITKDLDSTDLIPRTFIPTVENLAKNTIPKYELVLKPNNASGGKKIVFGEDCSEQEWTNHLQACRSQAKDWVVQQRCELPKEDNLYSDIAVYMADGEVKGLISRTSQDKVVNVGNGGALKPVVLTRGNHILNKKLYEADALLFQPHPEVQLI